MTKKYKRQCGTGKLNSGERKAIADWKRQRAKFGINQSDQVTFGDTIISFVAALPAPPVPGTPEYMRCVGYWMGAYMCAAQQDAAAAQIISLGTTKDGYLSSYANCIVGTWT